MDTAKTKPLKLVQESQTSLRASEEKIIIKKALTKRVKIEIISLDHYARIINLLSYSSWHKDVSSGFLMNIHNCITDLTDKYGYPT